MIIDHCYKYYNITTYLTGLVTRPGVPAWGKITATISSFIQHHILKLGGGQRATLPGPGANTRPGLFIFAGAALTTGLKLRQTRQVGQTASCKLSLTYFWMGIQYSQSLTFFIWFWDSLLLFLSRRVLIVCQMFIFSKINIPLMLLSARVLLSLFQ